MVEEEIITSAFLPPSMSSSLLKDNFPASSFSIDNSKCTFGLPLSKSLALENQETSGSIRTKLISMPLFSTSFSNSIADPPVPLP